jgi:hypothetical protein
MATVEDSEVNEDGEESQDIMTNSQNDIQKDSVQSAS